MTPGKQKRGKAAKQAIDVFSRARDTPASHKGLIKGVTDNECVQAMIGDVKVAVAGLAQATQVQYSTVQYDTVRHNACSREDTISIRKHNKPAPKPCRTMLRSTTTPACVSAVCSSFLR